MTKITRWFPEAIVFGGIFTILLMLCTPDMTWINTDCDGPHYIYSAKYLYPAHKTSAPLFLLLGHLFLMIPYGLDAWRMALMSVLASSVTAVFVYLTVRHFTGNRWYSLLGSVIWGTSALAISQSTIIETYALVTMFGVMAYYFSLKKKWLLTALCLGAGGAVHHLILIPLVVILVFNKDIRKWKYIGVMASFLLFYLYIPLTNREPYMWFSGSNLETNFFVDNLSTMLMLVGGLAIWDIPKRILDTIGLVGTSLTLSALIILWWIFKGDKRTFYKQPLFWLLLVPILYYAIDLAPQTYVYALPAIAFGAIATGIALPKLNRRWITALVLISTLAIAGYNINYFDIGRTLDPNLEARQFYDNELPAVPDGEILLSQQGWEWAMVYLYNREEGRDIIPVCAGTLPSPNYQQQLDDWGINYTVNKDEPLRVMSTNIALSIVDQNENVWTTLGTDTRNYGAEIVPAEENREGLVNIPQTITDGSYDMQWRWKPSNPYDIITGAIEVNEWVWIVFSNYTVLTFVMMATIGAVPVWIVYQFVIKKRKWSIGKMKDTISGGMK